MVRGQGYAALVDSGRRLGEDASPRALSAERRTPAFAVEPGKEEEFAYVRGWLASSEWLDRLIAAAEPGDGDAGLKQAAEAGGDGRDQMFSILDEATIQTAAAIREDEVRRLLAEREVRRLDRAGESSAWHWRVEPRMEEAFENLRGWLLRDERHAPVEANGASRGSDARPAERVQGMPGGARCRRQRARFPRPLSSVLTHVRRPSQAILRVSRRLLQ